ncbi:hypothetical protein [Romboutsia sp.]|uniref:hypothetical protein n=1 Tax=Romboutsia sp. TaxID=1965302 RepID=UPI003F2A9833
MINVLSRDLNEKTKQVIANGYIPGVIYGNQLEQSIPVKLYKTDFKRLIETNGHKGILELNLNGEVKNCLITDVQIDGLRDTFLHIDFKLV